MKCMVHESSNLVNICTFIFFDKNTCILIIVFSYDDHMLREGDDI